ncbi:FAD-dependent oxidoreductase [Actinoplanes sp. NPDC049802]|uniref:FAD-dependent oxidoreductase n=1 Tax=Actinoplanes sp. NPDC049802 TaxID=3154742 RepID=UPI0034088AB1
MGTTPVEPDFDVIVVGGGIAGCVTAYLLAQSGHSVALLERGEQVGSKNLSGGVFYAKVMEQVFPDFLTTAPVERRIDRNQLVFVNDESWVGVDYTDSRLSNTGTAVTVLRGRLDAWLGEQCEQAGVMVMPGIRVDELLREGSAADPRIVGVRAGEDELRARVVVAADGVNSFLARGAGLRTAPPLHHLAVGVKGHITLPRRSIEERFGLTGDRGAALALVGSVTKGVGGGAFLYTNTESISLGVVLRLDDLTEKGLSSAEIFDDFLAHPLIAGYVEGGQLSEYGCHLVAEGGLAMRGRVTWDGLLIVGEAAGMTINNGLTVRGMDLAAQSAISAAGAITAALAADDTSSAGLAGYETSLDASFAGADLKTYAKAPAFMENPRLYKDYGPLLADVMHGVFGLDATPRRSLLTVARHALKGSPVTLKNLALDAWGAVRAL